MSKSFSFLIYDGPSRAVDKVKWDSMYTARWSSRSLTGGEGQHQVDYQFCSMLAAGQNKQKIAEIEIDKHAKSCGGSKEGGCGRGGAENSLKIPLGNKKGGHHHHFVQVRYTNEFTPTSL